VPFSFLILLYFFNIWFDLTTDQRRPTKETETNKTQHGPMKANTGQRWPTRTTAGPHQQARDATRPPRQRRAPAPAATTPAPALVMAAATGARDACLEPRYVYFFIYFIIHTNDILLTLVLLNQTRKAHESQRRPTTVNAG
jgi:hypothetical protein